MGYVLGFMYYTLSSRGPIRRIMKLIKDMKLINEGTSFSEIHGHEISQFILDIGSRKTKEEVIAVVQGYYLKYPGMFRKPLERVPYIVDQIFGDTSPDIMQSRQYILAQLLTNYRELPKIQQEDWEKFMGIQEDK